MTYMVSDKIINVRYEDLSYNSKTVDTKKLLCCVKPEIYASLIARECLQDNTYKENSK